MTAAPSDSYTESLKSTEGLVQSGLLEGEIWELEEVSSLSPSFSLVVLALLLTSSLRILLVLVQVRDLAGEHSDVPDSDQGDLDGSRTLEGSEMDGKELEGDERTVTLEELLVNEKVSNEVHLNPRSSVDHVEEELF